MKSLLLKTILLGLCAFSASYAFARVPREIFQPDTEVGFYRPEKLPKLPDGGMERALAASIRLEIGDGTCSGVVVSTSGHVLTASHCVTDCLAENEAIDMEQSVNAKFLAYIKPKLKPNLVCKIKSAELGATEAKLLYAGPLLMVPHGVVMKLPENVLKHVLEMEKSNTDLAVLKFEVATKPTCLAMADRIPFPGDYAWAMGFPGRTLRRNGLDSEGKGTELVSYGKVLGEINPALFRGPEERQGYRLLNSVSGGMHIVSDMDIFSGNSGGLWMNNKAELIAISSAIMCPPIEGVNVNSCLVDYYQGNALAENALVGRQRIQAALGAAATAEIFACPK